MKHGNEFYVERKLYLFGIIPVGKVKVHRAFAEVNTFTEEEPTVKKEREIDVELSKYNEKQHSHLLAPKVQTISKHQKTILKKHY